MLCGPRIKIWNLSNHIKNETQMLHLKASWKDKKLSSWWILFIWLQHFEFKLVNCKIWELFIYIFFCQAIVGFMVKCLLSVHQFSFLSFNKSQHKSLIVHNMSKILADQPKPTKRSVNFETSFCCLQLFKNRMKTISNIA